MVTMVNFMVCIFYHWKKKKKEQRAGARNPRGRDNKLFL